MDTNYFSFESALHHEQSRRSIRSSALPRVLCVLGGTLAGCVLVAGGASGQTVTDPSRVIGGNPAEPADLTPGGGAGPGKIEHGTITGTAVPMGGNQVRVVHCAADINDDGSVGIDDLFDFFVYFDLGDHRADLVGDRVFGFEDLLVFLEAFNEGC